MEEILFSCHPSELSCIVGNLFATIEPPCGYHRSDELTIYGTTPDGSPALLVIKGDRYLYCGPPDALETARNGSCPERRCEHG